MTIASFVQGLDIQPGEVDRVILHWTGGGANPAQPDLRAYHALIDQSLTLHRGKFSADDNIDTSDRIYAAHTLQANTRAFGLSLCGMHGAVENRTNGPVPITRNQFELSAQLTAQILLAAGLPCERHTALSHAEVQETLGIQQRGKWDINVLPWRTDLKGARVIGDYWRDQIRGHMGQGQETFAPAATLRAGNKAASATVRLLQIRLNELGYPVGKTDGFFGSRTRGAVLTFQADQGLVTDGIVGPKTWEALYAAEKRPERNVTLKDLRESGSRTVVEADRVQQGTAVVAGGGVLTAIMENADDVSSAMTQAVGWADTAQVLLVEYWPVVVLAVVGLAVWHYATRIKEARLEDARTGANLAR